MNTEIEEAQKIKAFLQNLDNMDAAGEERRRSNNEKISRLLNTRNDCDGDLRSFIDEYNKYKKPFTDQCVSVCLEKFECDSGNRIALWSILRNLMQVA